MTSPASRIDVRTIAPYQRHALIFSAFEGLATGQALELVNDHDPAPLRQQFHVRLPGQFDWYDLEQGPTWRVAITRVQAAPGNDGKCCGACGGT